MDPIAVDCKDCLVQQALKKVPQNVLAACLTLYQYSSLDKCRATIAGSLREELAARPVPLNLGSEVRPPYNLDRSVFEEAANIHIFLLRHHCRSRRHADRHLRLEEAVEAEHLPAVLPPGRLIGLHPSSPPW